MSASARFGEGWVGTRRARETERPVLSSKRRLTEALVAENHATGNNDGWRVIQAITRDYCHRESAVGEWTRDLPIQTSDGKRGAVVFTWKRREDPWEEAA